MDQEGEIQSAVLCEQLPQVQDFVQNLTYYRSLSSCTKPFEGDFFDVAGYAFLKAATLAWCNVFADRKSDVYWSKLIDEMPEEVKLDFENRIRKSTDLTEKQYQEYQCSIRALRDKYVAHTDLDWQKSVSHDLSFDIALRIAMQYECWLKDLLRKEDSFTPGCISFNDIIESAKGDVMHLTTTLSSQNK